MESCLLILKDMTVYEPVSAVEGYSTRGIEMICDCDGDGECCGN